MPVDDGRHFRLNAFRIHGTVAERPAPKSRIENAIATRIAKVRDRLDRQRPWYLRNVVVQPHFHFAPDFFKAGPNAVIEGYWQSPKYFEGEEERIRADFQFKEPGPGSLELIEKMSRPDSVGVHVRRGDYVSNPVYAARYRVMGCSYYANAFEKIKQELGATKLFVFSDDLPWCAHNLTQIADVELVDGGSDLGDFRLMSMCAHHVISNSTFAWWAAWLATTPNHQVVAPAEWYFMKDYDLRDLFPADWSLVPV
jgi:hypothetical protein